MYIIPKNYWAAELSNGQKIVEDEKQGEKSAWIRLREYLNSNKDIKIDKLHLHAYGRDLYLNNSGVGFFHAKSVESIPEFGYENKRYSIGYVKNGLATITWICSNGSIEEEIRQVFSSNISVIS